MEMLEYEQARTGKRVYFCRDERRFCMERRRFINVRRQRENIKTEEEKQPARTVERTAGSQISVRTG
jgi:hypothetical protein